MQRNEVLREQHGAKPDGSMDDESIEYDAGEDRFALDPTDPEDAAILQTFFGAAKPLGMTQEQIAGILDWLDDHSFEIAMRADDPKNGDRIRELQMIQRKDARRYENERLDLELSGLLRQKNRREKRGA